MYPYTVKVSQGILDHKKRTTTTLFLLFLNDKLYVSGHKIKNKLQILKPIQL